MARSDPSPIDSQSLDPVGGVVVLAACGTFGAVDVVSWLATLAMVAAVRVEHRRTAASSARPIAERLLFARAIWMTARATQLLP